MVVPGMKIDGGTQTISAGLQKTIKSIKEIVGNHSDADIYVTLKETNMDPNESVQKLLHQDTFHEVKRRRDKKRENTVFKDSVQPRRNFENVGQEVKYPTFSDRNGRRDGYIQNSFTGRSREFRVVRDNRVKQNTNREAKPASQQCSASANGPIISNLSEKGSTGTSNSEKPLGGRKLSQAPSGMSDSHLRPVRDANSSGNDMKQSSERRITVSNTGLRGHAGKPNDSHRNSARPASSNSIVGVYSSTSDPVHVPSLDSRSSAAVGAIRREVGVVGVRRHSSESVKHSSIAGSSSTNFVLGTDNAPSAESIQDFNSVSKGNLLNQTTSPPSMSVSRPFFSNHYGNRSHQQPVGHQKAFRPNKVWKPKSSKISSDIIPGMIGSPAKSDLPSADNSTELKSESVKLQDKLSQADLFENQNVVIAEHIRVAETDRCLLTFGSIGPGFQAVGSSEDPRDETSSSLSVPAPESSRDDISGSEQVDNQDDHVASSGSHSPGSGAAAEHQLPSQKESLSPQNLDSYADIGMVRETNQFYAPSESQQQQEATELPSFSAYDPQTGYDIPYFRPIVDESLRGQGLPSPQEALSSYTANSIPASTIALVQQQQQQQQQQPMAQMYPQVHVSHFANLMPYRQFLSPVYVPPMAMPGYSNNPAYPHPSNGSSYLLMPGGNSHPNASSVKYGIQQFKPLPNGSPTGFGNFTSPTGYPVNTPGVVGSAIGLEDSSRLKYKDGNLYVSNPQAETSEIWIQNPRELPGMQSAPYYSMTGQTPHGAYMPSHTGHASFNSAAQSSHMQFPGLYHPQQPAALPSPHHLAPAMGGNVGVGVAAAAPGPQVGAYQQQPQLNHLNWITNL